MAEGNKGLNKGVKKSWKGKNRAGLTFGSEIKLEKKGEKWTGILKRKEVLTNMFPGVGADKDPFSVFGGLLKKEGSKTPLEFLLGSKSFEILLYQVKPGEIIWSERVVQFVQPDSNSNNLQFELTYTQVWENGKKFTELNEKQESTQPKTGKMVTTSAEFTEKKK